MPKFYTFRSFCLYSIVNEQYMLYDGAKKVPGLRADRGPFLAG
jgi:hypothetical protein